ncbi:MAG: hypothetical protein HYR66_04050 [Sphingobacteriales bacterium]|nr:hypothetical protein [Sphingobacteriales bacterium]MBI3719137.1 hypothetical protein [Sphingobacteriales bacterium]
MKKILTVLFVFIAVNSFAQTDSTKKSRQELIDSVCVCAAKQDTSLIKTKDDLQKLVLQCFMQRMDIFLKAMQEENIDMTDAEAQKNYGQQLGMEMVMKCPVLLQLSVKVASQELNDPPKAAEKKTPAAKPKTAVKPSTTKPKTTTKAKG